MARRITVVEFALRVTPDSDNIPVKIVDRTGNVIGKAESLYKLASKGAVGIQERKLAGVTIKQDEIIVRVY